MKLTTLLLSLLFAGLSFAQEVNDIAPSQQSGLRIKLAAEKYFTDTNGVFSVAQLIKATVGNQVRIYRTDGGFYTGQITEIEETSEYLKIYGYVFDGNDTRFGFALAKGGVFAGAVVEKNKDKVYTVEFSAAHKGYILLRAQRFESL
jgi:hypothetical protein